MVKLSLATMERILKENGAERVSKDAKVALAKILEEQCASIAKLALRYALFSGRKTITAQDIKLALKSKVD